MTNCTSCLSLWERWLSEDGECKQGCKALSYYFLIKIFDFIRKASPNGAAGFVIYKERNHKTSLI